MSVANDISVAETAAAHADILYLPSGSHDRGAARDRLSRGGRAVLAATDVGAAVRLLGTRRFTMCIVDLPDERALSSVRLLRGAAPSLFIAAIVDPSNPSMAGEALRAGSSDILPWPFEERDLSALISDASDRVAIEPSPESPEDPGLIASSPAMRVVRDLAGEAAQSYRAVLLVGEPHTGRTRLARTIHDGGLTAGRAFVEVDCAAAPADLERLLFGGALPRRVVSGRAESTEAIGPASALIEARGGTLFLTQILDAPARVQARLARVLRDREASVADDGGPIDLELRVVSAVEASVDAGVADGRLRRDLYDRLSHLRIDVPPLRRRREDLPQLAMAMARGLAEARGIPPKSFSRSALSLIAALPWRGNGAELRALVETLVGDVRRPVIQLEDVLEHACLDGGGTHVDPSLTLRDAKMRFERDCISAVLVRHHGRVGDAARALGIQRTNLYRKVRQLNVSRSLLSARK